MAEQKANNPGTVKVLSIVWFNVYPPKFGGQKAVALFNEQLAAYTPLLCLCAKNNKASSGNHRIQNTLPVGQAAVINPFVWRKIYTVAKREKMTHLLLEFPYYGFAGILCKKLLRMKLVVNMHNLEYSRFKEQKAWWWLPLYFLEKKTLQAADAVFFKTETDLQIARKRFGLSDDKLSLIPYGVDKNEIHDKKSAQDLIRKRHGFRTGEKIFLFAGTLDYGPNAEAVVNICEKLTPLLNQRSLQYKIVVCGRNRYQNFAYLNRLQNDKLVMAGEVEDVEPYFEAADLFIDPVLTGGGIQTKIMDALSYHLNVVCFKTKAGNIMHASSKIFAVPDGDWKAFANAAYEAMTVSDPTPSAFFDAYNWRSIAAKAYQKILSC